MNEQKSVLRVQVPRFHQLDAVRGVAALAVVVGHLWIAYNTDVGSSVFRSPVSPYITGPFSVILFFVLSGFVLSLPLIAGKTLPYEAYLIRRVIRLYAPYLAALCVAVLLWATVGASAHQSRFAMVQTSWGQPIGVSAILRHVGMVGWPNLAFELDPPIWSLIVEMRASILFPLLFILARRTGWLGVIIGAALTIAAVLAKAHIGDASGISAQSATGSILLTLRYLGFFVFGIVAALKLDEIVSVLRRVPSLLHVGCFIGFIGGLAVLARGNHINTPLNDIYYGLFAAYLICLCVTSHRAAALLGWGPLPWLGRISFSLYLIHWPVICAVIIVLAGRVGLPVALIVALPASLAAGAAMERWVERGSHKASRRISKELVSRNIFGR